MKITFFGATGAVTGSLYYVETEGKNFIVDCGLYQTGGDDLKLNEQLPEIDLDMVDFVILTHAHIDHCGRIPLLIKNGLKKKIYCTEATAHLTEILLKDSAKVILSENELENKKRIKAGLEIVEPFITEEDVYESIAYLYPINYDKIIVDGNLEIRFFNAGHLLGSASVKVIDKISKKSIVFSGDIGSGHNALLESPSDIGEANYIVTESTYGSREHHNLDNRIQQLAQTIEDELKQNRNILIPSFAVGRTQEVIFELIEYYKRINAMDRFLSIPIYLDSPLSHQATKIFKKEYKYLKPSVANMIESGKDIFSSKNIQIVEDMKDSIRLAKDISSKVVIASSGMCQGGRIISHLKYNVQLENYTIIFIGYQAEGSIGRQLLEKAPVIKIADDEYSPKCKIIKIDGFSGHGDRKALKTWIDKIQNKKHIFITHGEDESREDLKEFILDLNTPITIPKKNQIISLE